MFVSHGHVLFLLNGAVTSGALYTHASALFPIGSCDVMYRFTYEVAPVFVLLEYVTLKKMREIIGWEDGRGDGIFSPGKISRFNVSIYI